jgi:putative two-component system response regulator
LTEAISAVAATFTDSGIGSLATGWSSLATGSGAIRILATDNRPEIALVIDRALAGRYTCELASNIEQARRMLGEGEFDLALCDIYAGGERAMILAEEIARGDLDTAVILIAGGDDPELARKAIEFGAYGYVLEPPRPGQLLATMVSALRQRELVIAQRERSQDNLELPRREILAVAITAGQEAVRLRNELADIQRKAIADLRLSRQETIEGLAMAIEIHDSLTGEHVQRVAAIASFLGAQLGLHPDRVQMLGVAAPMHDVGKIGTPEEILLKPGPLTAEERETMEKHAAIGHEIFARFESELSKMAATIAFTHHERYDGSGYPHGLAGEKIPLEGRITAVADVFDALISDRSYRPAMSMDEAVTVMGEGRGTQFDPEIVDVLLDHVEEAVLVRGPTQEERCVGAGLP